MPSVSNDDDEGNDELAGSVKERIFLLQLSDFLNAQDPAVCN
jgi:hypothetical protein